jgi:hypothetical protein
MTELEKVVIRISIIIVLIFIDNLMLATFPRLCDGGITEPLESKRFSKTTI